MSRIQSTFSRLAKDRRAALIPFVTAGFPTPATTVPLMHAMVAAGADVIELGVPFSDPMADGPAIQRASEAALAQGMRLLTVLAQVAEFRQQDGQTPVVLMGYANPIEAMGVAKFTAEAAAAGVDGVLVVDYPPEEADEFAAAMRAAGMDPIFLIAPTSSRERIARTAAIASGYVYYVSLAGVTGSAALNIESVAQKLPQIRQLTGLPVGVGFGIRDAAAAARIAAFADAVIVGSRLIETIEQSSREECCARVAAVLADMRRAMDEVNK